MKKYFNLSWRFKKRKRVNDGPVDSHQASWAYSKSGADDFFADQNIYPSKVIYIVSFILFVFIALVFALKNIDQFNFSSYVCEQGSECRLSRFIVLCFDQALGVLVSLWASIYAVRYLNIINFRRNYVIRSIAHDDLLKSVFGMLACYNQRHRLDQKIDIVLSPCEESKEILHLKIFVEYYSNLTSNKLIFLFNRFSKDDCRGRDSLTISPFDYEFHSSMDDSGFMRTLSVDERGLDKFYSVESLSVDHSYADIELQRFEHDPNKWEFTVKRTIPSDKMVKVQFELNMPIFRRGYYYITPVFPTKNLEVSFDYALLNNIDAWCDNLLSSTEIFMRPPVSNKSKIVVSHRGWVLPKSSIYFHWKPQSFVKNI